MTMPQNTQLSPIEDIQPFIDLEYNTVPLNGGHIIRDAQGKKKGFSFPSKWAEKYSKTFNDLATPIGAILTGMDGLVAIDCDCNASWELFRSLDPTNTAYFNSLGKLDKEGKELVCGTILYLYSPSLPTSKKMKGQYDLDYFNGTGCVFLPTAENHTKSSWLSNPNADYPLYNQEHKPVVITKMPNNVKSVLDLILNANRPLEKTVADTQHSIGTQGYLGKILADFDLAELIADNTYEPKLTKLLTPKEYRTELYSKQGHLHPNDVPARHDYQFKIMCQLAGDNTVDVDTAREVIYYLNSLWDTPRPAKQLESEVIGGIISGRQKNPKGEPYWVYDENWQTLAQWTGVTKAEGELLEIFYDPFTKDYVAYNTQSDHIEVMPKHTDMVNHIRASCIGTLVQQEAIEDMKNVTTLVNPKEDFGYLEDNKKFNLFKPTEALRILADPTRHEAEYTEPTEFIAYMEHFMPDEEQREYFLSLIRTKLTTFSYSPVVPYIIGIPGSGKGLLMTILERIMGTNYVSKEVSGIQFINGFNKGWLEHKYFVNLNELAEGLQNKAERTKAVGDLKLYSGSTSFQCHGKHRNVYSAPMTAMFIMTANHNPLSIEDADRRIYYIGTPNTFNSAPQCLASKSSNVIFQAILSQIDNIAYWLATKVENLSDNAYTTAPYNAGKNELIFSSKNTSEKIAWALANREFDMLHEFLINPTPLYRHHAESRVYLDDLEVVYAEHSSNDDATKILKVVMKKAGFAQKQGTKNAVYWYIDGFRDFDAVTADEDDEAEEIPLEEVVRV